MKSKSLGFYLPISMNFSEFEFEDKNYAIEEASRVEEDKTGIWVEKTIMAMLAELEGEKERLTLLFLIMRGDGYNFDHQSVANLYRMKLRGYMRVIQRVKRKLEKYNANSLTQPLPEP